MTKFKLRIAAGFCMGLFALSAHAQSENTDVTYVSGPAPGPVFGALDSDDGQMGSRPTSCSAAVAAGVGGFKYDTMTFFNNGSTTVTVTYNVADASQLCGNGANDPELIVYTGSGGFNPNTPLVNCEQVVVSPTNDACASVNFPVGPGASKTVVLTSKTAFNNPRPAGPAGTPPNGLFGYQGNFSSPTPVSLQSFGVDQ
jgi:hypothetical protein